MENKKTITDDVYSQTLKKNIELQLKKKARKTQKWSFDPS